MTKWQESCITALASSPMAWEAFKMKQRNRKLLWQYINRIWPYKLIAGTKVNKNKKDLLAIARILKNLSSTIQYYVPGIERASCIEDVDVRFDKVDWLCIKDIISKEDSEYKRIVRGAYRFAKINFNYSDYVIQILTFIHITECIKHDAPFNIQYLELLYKVMKNLNNN